MILPGQGKATREDMEKMLLSEFADAPPEIIKMSDEFREELENTDTGSVAFLYTGNIRTNNATPDLVILQTPPSPWW